MSKKTLKLLASEPTPAIDWAAVDSAPQADAPDADSPALKAADLPQLRALGDLLPGLAGGKTRITIMVDDAVLQAYKARAGGRGYQTLMNEALGNALRGQQWADTVRQVVREELQRTGV